jgi:hypothetical protein
MRRTERSNVNGHVKSFYISLWELRVRLEGAQDEQHCPGEFSGWVG